MGEMKLINGLDQWKIPYEMEHIEDFEVYRKLLVDWNTKMNLTGITETEEVYIKHFLDSLSPFKLPYIQNGDRIIDVGTGAGFPGLPMKVLNRSLTLTLLDSLNKRVQFLNTVSESIGLQAVECIHGRAEDYGKNPEYRETYDVAVSRAVANLSVLSEYVLPFVKVGGYFIALKGPDVQAEVDQAVNAIETLGGRVKETHEFVLPGTDITHSMVVVEKIKETPKKYPRKAGKPSKSPLQ